MDVTTLIQQGEKCDINIDEQASRLVRVICTNDDGSLMDITDGTVNWVASFNGLQQIKKDTATMMVMLDPQTSTTLSEAASAAQKVLTVDAVKAFGADGWGRPIADLAVGDILTLTNASTFEYGTIASIDATAKTITLVNNLTNSYSQNDVVAKIVSSFTFELLPGDTILPATKAYGTAIIWQHMALVTFAGAMSPENINAVSTTVVGIRGRMFILPILDMS